MPRGIPNNRTLDAAAEYLGAEKSAPIEEMGDRELAVYDKPIPKDDLEREKFMNEVLTVQVHESTDENASDLVQVGVNGITQYLRRGVPQDVKRKYVEVLARAKPTDYNQTIDERLGEAMNVLRQRHGLKYPFSVMHDPNPNGAAWLKAVLAEG